MVAIGNFHKTPPHIIFSLSLFSGIFPDFPIVPIATIVMGCVLNLNLTDGSKTDL